MLGSVLGSRWSRAGQGEVLELSLMKNKRRGKKMRWEGREALHREKTQWSSRHSGIPGLGLCGSVRLASGETAQSGLLPDCGVLKYYFHMDAVL
jgi:hypothetical protein